MAEENLLASAKDSLARVASFDVRLLPRREDLGTLNFEAAKAPAQRVIDLFKKLPPEALDEFPDGQLSIVKDQADQFYQILSTILKFSAEAQANPGSERDALVQQLTAQYGPIFKALSPLISYGVARTVDFNRLEEQGRAAVQRIQDQTDGALKHIGDVEGQISKTLEEVRKAAAEQGVSQQAIYFKQEADTHETKATTWLKWTLASATLLVLYSIASLFFHHIPGLDPSSTYEAVQLGASKLLIFLVIAYIVLTCGRNFMAHTHNAIVNRHRQNGLQTFTTLVGAAGSQQAQDIVLSHAAASIFEPQETGFAKQQLQDGALTAATVVRSLAAPHAIS